MKVLNVKIENGILQEIDKNLIKNRYSTRSEFVRDAIRSKLSELEKEEMLKHVITIKGKSKYKTTEEQLHKSREEIGKLLEKRFK
jgi:metal-responsive CopG/Arc/MetJ family transcriptional regulator